MSVLTILSVFVADNRLDSSTMVARLRVTQVPARICFQAHGESDNQSSSFHHGRKLMAAIRAVGNHASATSEVVVLIHA